ncbi:type IV pilus modification protein PilV [Halomonas denitrificans]|uniref:type IV pilus modification protein PilV n=1 Tax=Halomonas TaxID=2745 RepID=UPI001C99EA78|nr:type IV pilus modification protein PilV [Halomonas denitrificans]MBY5970152.1 type IV pilus modification protein PilV [Halomonas denitrificans]
MSTPARQRGFSLLEALVALLLLSVGLLGIAGLQLRSLQGAHSSIQRSLADLAAQDARELLWASMTALDGECPPDAAQSLRSHQWHQHWAPFLPGLADADQSIEPAEDCAFKISIRWQDERFSDPSVFEYWVKLPARDHI